MTPRPLLPLVGMRWKRAAGWQITLAAALLALGFLIAVQVQSQAPRARYSSQERPPLVETALDLSNRQGQLTSDIAALRAQIQDLESHVGQEDAEVAALNAELVQARIAAGLVALSGPGVAVQFDDARVPLPLGANPSDYRVQAEDLRDLVNALWLSGAEAIAVNGERIVVSTAITDIGGTVLVNSAYLAPPYVVTAIGPQDLYGRFTASDGLRALLDSRVGPFSLDLRAGPANDLLIPAYAGTIRVVEARPGPTPTPGPGTTP